MPVLSKEVNEKFRKVADETKTFTALPRWGDVYHLGDRPDLYKAPKVNERFSRLLDKPVFSSRYVAFSLEDTSKLEACVLGFIESQSFSLWSIATMFEFLKDANCLPEDSIFHQLIASMTAALNSQDKAPFSSRCTGSPLSPIFWAPRIRQSSMLFCRRHHRLTCLMKRSSSLR